MSMFGDDRDNLKLVSANSLELLRGQTDPGALHPA